MELSVLQSRISVKYYAEPLAFTNRDRATYSSGLQLPASVHGEAESHRTCRRNGSRGGQVLALRWVIVVSRAPRRVASESVSGRASSGTIAATL
jgi:hypothetical protein